MKKKKKIKKGMLILKCKKEKKIKKNEKAFLIQFWKGNLNQIEAKAF